MDGAVILAIVLLAWGSMLIWETALQWRRSPEENQGLVDKGLSKLMGTDKLPLTWFDRFLNRFRLVRKSVYGLGMLLVGGLIVFAKLGVL